MPIAGCVIVALTLLYASVQHLVLRDLPQQQPNNKQNKATASSHKRIKAPPTPPPQKNDHKFTLRPHASTVHDNRVNIQAKQRYGGMDVITPAPLPPAAPYSQAGIMT